MSKPQHQPPGLFETLRQEMRLKGYSHETMKAYRSCIRAFVRYLQPKHPREASDADIREFLLHLVDNEDYAESTVNQVINALRFLYVDLYKRTMQLGDLPRPKKERKLPEILSEDEVMRILHSAENLKHKTILMFVYSAGLRVGEVVRLRLSDVDEQRKLIHLHKAKGAKDRFTVLSTSLLETLAEYLLEYRLKEFLFEGQGDRRHYSGACKQSLNARRTRQEY